MADDTNLTSVATAKCWAKSGDTFWPCEESVSQLGAGQFTIESSPQRGIYFSKIDVNTDELMVLPDTASDKIIGQIEDFWGKKQKYKDFSFVWKRGFLLWGPPGSGKTTTIQLVAQNIIAKDGICVFVKNPSVAAAGLEVLRKIEPERPVVVILEDIDSITQRHSDAELLALLDGELQIQNVVFLATTNYPEKLDKRLVNRPSRFDVVQKIDFPNKEARRMFLLRKNPTLATRTVDNVNADEKARLEKLSLAKHTEILETDQKIDVLKGKMDSASELDALEYASNLKELEKNKNTLYKAHQKLTAEIAATATSIPEIDVWVDQTNNFSIAHLKELILSVELFEVPLETTIKRLKMMMDRKLNQDSGGDANI